MKSGQNRLSGSGWKSLWLICDEPEWCLIASKIEEKIGSTNSFSYLIRRCPLMDLVLLLLLPFKRSIAICSHFIPKVRLIDFVRRSGGAPISTVDVVCGIQFSFLQCVLSNSRDSWRLIEVSNILSVQLLSALLSVWFGMILFTVSVS